jgi:hypothetical protein
MVPIAMHSVPQFKCGKKRFLHLWEEWCERGLRKAIIASQAGHLLPLSLLTEINSVQRAS